MIASEKPSGAVPRSSAMTRQRARWLSSRSTASMRLERVGHIGAFRRRRAGRDQEQPLQLEGVVDADRAGVAHVRGDERPEGREPLFLEGERVERRQSPVLALRPERIGRRADRERRRRTAPDADQTSEPPGSAPTARSR